MAKRVKGNGLMPVFYNDDLLFIHIPKCGGCSVTNAARKGLPGFIEPGVKRKHHKPGVPIGHIRAVDFEHFTGRPLNTFKRIFATTRDPVATEWSKWNFWRMRYFQDGEFVSWRHPADQFAWDRTFDEFVSSGIDPFNEWYCNEIVEDAKPDYNDVGRFNWWLTEQVETVRIEDVEKINKILRSHGCETKVGHDNRTGVGPVIHTRETIETIRGYYEGVAA